MESLGEKQTSVGLISNVSQEGKTNRITERLKRKNIQRHAPLHSSDGHPRGSEQDVLFSGGFPSPPAVSGNDVTEFPVRDANPHFRSVA